MKLSDFDYYLPKELIAAYPKTARDQARLLVLDKKSGEMEHKIFSDVIDYLEAGDVLVLNDSKVIPARLIGKKESGGELEIFLSKFKNDFWECLVKGRVKPGQKVIFSDKLKAELIASNDDSTWMVRFNLTGSEFFHEMERIGQMPLPPYIIKSRQSSVVSRQFDDREDYQTVYADDAKPGSVAAPTAGLHFTPELLEKIKAKGVRVEYVTLHVGLGTFLPVKTENIEEHKIHSEWTEVPQNTIAAILRAKAEGKRVVAVGTTTARTLEYFFKFMPAQAGILFSGWVDIFIYPGYQFKVVDALVTNFHLPKSTLLMLVSALAGKKSIDKAYQEAIKRKYRFYSYGDAMLID